MRLRLQRRTGTIGRLHVADRVDENRCRRQDRKKVVQRDARQRRDRNERRRERRVDVDARCRLEEVLVTVDQNLLDDVQYEDRRGMLLCELGEAFVGSD